MRTFWSEISDMVMLFWKEELCIFGEERGEFIMLSFFPGFLGYLLGRKPGESIGFDIVMFKGGF